MPIKVAYFGSKAYDATETDWMTSLSVNVAGAGYMMSACVHHMNRAKPGRRSICLLTSISGSLAQPNRWTYGACKGALWTLVRQSALDLARDFQIRVNSVSPAWIWTPEVAKVFSDKQDCQQSAGRSFHMLGRVGETNEVAAAISFLASRDASFIHGVDLPGILIKSYFNSNA